MVYENLAWGRLEAFPKMFHSGKCINEYAIGFSGKTKKEKEAVSFKMFIQEIKKRCNHALKFSLFGGEKKHSTCFIKMRLRQERS